MLTYYLQIGSLKGFYLFEHQRVRKRSIEANSKIHETLSAEPEVSFCICNMIIKLVTLTCN